MPSCVLLPRIPPLGADRCESISAALGSYPVNTADVCTAVSPKTNNGLLPDTDIGNTTCGGGAGILGHEASDARDYAAWGVDLVKNDDCHHAANCTAAYAATWAALVATGRPMVHMTKSSLDIKVAPLFAQARRVSKDITWLFSRVMSLVYQQQSWNQGLANRSGIQPGGSGFWNDMDSKLAPCPSPRSRE